MHYAVCMYDAEFEQKMAGHTAARRVITRRKLAGRMMRSVTVSLSVEHYERLERLKGSLSLSVAVERMIDREHRRRERKAA